LAKKSKAELSRIANKAVAKRKKNRQSKIATGAAAKNRLSEENFVKRLKKKGFLAFSTGKAEGVPDIIAFKGGNLSFYEVKPSNPKSARDALFKKTQSNWIKKYCFRKNLKANIVFYKGSRNFKYHVIRITKQNIIDFEDNNINRALIKNMMEYFSFK